MGSKKFLIIAVAAALALPCYLPALSAQSRTSEVKLSDEAERAQNAASVLKEIMEAPDQSIQNAYGKEIEAAEISKGTVRGAGAAVVRPFLDALQKYAPKK